MSVEDHGERLGAAVPMVPAQASAEPAQPTHDQTSAAEPNPDDRTAEDRHAGASAADAILAPETLVRLGHVANNLNDELRGTELDPAGRKRLAALYVSVAAAVRQAVAEELQAELDMLTPPLSSSSTPSQSELAVALACLVGWLDGLAVSSTYLFVPKQAVAIDSQGHAVIVGGPGGRHGPEVRPSGLPSHPGAGHGPGEGDGGQHTQGNYL